MTRRENSGMNSWRKIFMADKNQWKSSVNYYKNTLKVFDTNYFKLRLYLVAMLYQIHWFRRK